MAAITMQSVLQGIFVRVLAAQIAGLLQTAMDEIMGLVEEHLGDAVRAQSGL
jgi:hypothetical protein